MIVYTGQGRIRTEAYISMYGMKCVFPSPHDCSKVIVLTELVAFWSVKEKTAECEVAMRAERGKAQRERRGRRSTTKETDRGERTEI